MLFIISIDILKQENVQDFSFSEVLWFISWKKNIVLRPVAFDIRRHGNWWGFIYFIVQIGTILQVKGKVLITRLGDLAQTGMIPGKPARVVILQNHLTDEKPGFATRAVPSQQLLLFQPLPGGWAHQILISVTIASVSHQGSPSFPYHFRYPLGMGTLCTVCPQSLEKGWGSLLLLPRRGQMYAWYPELELTACFSMVEEDYYEVSIPLRVKGYLWAGLGVGQGGCRTEGQIHHIFGKKTQDSKYLTYRWIYAGWAGAA